MTVQSMMWLLVPRLSLRHVRRMDLHELLIPGVIQTATVAMPWTALGAIAVTGFSGLWFEAQCTGSLTATDASACLSCMVKEVDCYARGNYTID